MGSTVEKGKGMSGVIAFMQPKGAETKYNNVVLGTFKFMQLVLSLLCTLVHIYSYSNHRLNMPHVTIFCGTYAGYVIVSAGMFMGYLVRYRATPEMDLYYCFVGGFLYNLAGIVSMFLAQKFPYDTDREGLVYVDISFLFRCVAHSVLSTITGSLYWIDFCINLDVFWSVRIRHQRQVMVGYSYEIQPGKKRTAVTEEDELELHCVCLDLIHDMKLVFKRLIHKETYERILCCKANDPEYDIEEFLQMAAEESARDRAFMPDADDSSTGRYRGTGGIHATSLHRLGLLRD